MGDKFDRLSEKHQEFIKKQKIFFVGTATRDSRINVSPKGMDTLRVIDANTLVWLNLTGSGNETSAHIQEDGRMTVMLTAFEGAPNIMRLYGKAKVIHRNDQGWMEFEKLFPPTPGSRQFFLLDIELVQTSCGFGVPFYDYKGERDTLSKWAVKKGEEGVAQYWVDKNQTSLDGQPTHIVEKNLSSSEDL